MTRNAGPCAPAGTIRLRRRRARKRLAPCAPHSERLPLLHRLANGAINKTEIEALRQHDFVAPARTAVPSVFLQIVGGRCEHVRNGSDDIAFSVPVEIDRKTLEGGRHELRRTERTCPRALQMLDRHVAALREFPASTGTRRGSSSGGGRCRRASRSNVHVPFSDRRAVVRFDPPDRRDDVAIDTVCRSLRRISHGCLASMSRPPAMRFSFTRISRYSQTGLVNSGCRSSNSMI